MVMHYNITLSWSSSFSVINLIITSMAESFLERHNIVISYLADYYLHPSV